MMGWNGYRTELMGRVGDLAQLTPDTVQGYMVANAAGAKTQNLDLSGTFAVLRSSARGRRWRGLDEPVACDHAL